MKKQLNYRTIIGVLALVIIGVGIVGCKKDALNGPVNLNTKSITKSTYIPHFADSTALANEMKVVGEMGEDERRNYEKSQGYKSLFTMIYELYENADTNSYQDLEVYISKFPEYLTIKNNEFGEREYYPFYSDNVYSIIAGTNRMFQVEDKYYKVFDDGMAFTNQENKSYLMSIDEVFLKDVKDDERIVKFVYDENDQEKSGCSDKIVERITNGKYRTKIKAEVDYTNTPHGMGTAFVRVRPYKKTLGIWFHSEQTINGEINFTIKYKLVESDTVISFSKNEKIENKKAFSYTTKYAEDTPFHFEYFKFSSINSWGKTTKTSKVKIQCP